MKKILSVFLTVGLLLNFVSASGCFHDHIDSVDKAGVITRWANVRNVACMLWSEVIDTLAAGTKVRIIWQTAWTEIVLPDWRVGRVWNNFISETNDWSWVPSYPNGYNAQSYCDTTNLYRCPNPSPLNVMPTWYYREYVDSGTTNYNQTNTTNNLTSTTTSSVNLSSTMKKAVENLVNQLMDKLEDKMWDDSSAKKDFLNVLVNKISKTNVSYKIKPVIDYLVELLENKITLLYVDSLFNLD